MVLRTLIFELCAGKYGGLPELARAMEVPAPQIDGVRQGKRDIDEKFIIGAIKAFPEYGIGHLFYFTPQHQDKRI